MICGVTQTRKLQRAIPGMREGSIMNSRAKDLPSWGWGRSPCRERQDESVLFKGILDLILPSFSDISALPP